MNIKQQIKNWLGIETENTPTTQQKEPISLGNIVAPVFHEVPPDTKAGKYLTEGMRSWAAIAITAIADEISTIPLKLFKKSGKNWEETENDQVLRLIEKPNSTQTKEELFWLVSVFLLAEGEAPLLLNNTKNPTEMILLNPDRIKLKIDEANGGVEKYIYTQSNGTTKPIEKDLIVFLKLPHTQTPFRGIGTMSYIKQTLDIENYLEEHLRIFFFNHAAPGGVLETNQTLDANIIKRLKTQFENRHKGVKNAHKLAVLTNGLKFNNTSFKMSELQMVETNNFIRDKVLAAFKVPKSVLGIIEDVNRSNGENSDRVFARRAVKPKLAFIQAQLNQYLLPKFGGNQNLWFEFENPVADDEKLKAEINDIYVKNGVLTIDEVREQLGLLPLIVQEQPPQEPKKDEPKKQAKTTKTDNVFVDLVKDIMGEKDFKSSFTEEETEKYHSDKIVFSNSIESSYRAKIEANFQRQERELMKQINKTLKKDISDIDFDKEKEKEIMAEISVPFLEDIILQQGTLTNALMGLHDDFKFDDTVREFIKTRSIKSAESVSQTTKEHIEKILKIWAEEKKTIPELKTMFKDFFGDKKRAHKIARTEISSGAGFATRESYKRVGAVGKKWLTARDERVCQFCEPMDGKIVAIDDNFFDRGEDMAGKDGGKISFDFESIKSYPLHTICRCDLLPVFDESELKGYADFKIENKKSVESLILKEKKQELEKKEKEINEKEQILEKDIQELEHIKKYG